MKTLNIFNSMLERVHVFPSHTLLPIELQQTQQILADGKEHRIPLTGLKSKANRLRIGASCTAQLITTLTESRVTPSIRKEVMAQIRAIDPLRTGTTGDCTVAALNLTVIKGSADVWLRLGELVDATFLTQSVMYVRDGKWRKKLDPEEVFGRLLEFLPSFTMGFPRIHDGRFASLKFTAMVLWYHAAKNNKPDVLDELKNLFQV